MAEAVIPSAVRERMDAWLRKGLKHFIDGKFVDSASGETFSVPNPATGQELTRCALGGKAEIDLAAKAAVRAFKTWGRMAPAERGKLLRRWAQLMIEHKDELNYLECMDVGRPIREGIAGYVERMAHNITFFADLAEKYYDEAFVLPGYTFYTNRQPVGVAGLITPWNMPQMLSTWKIGPALAAGNTVILKPAELTPVGCTRLAELSQEAGIPDGVFNVVHGFGPDSAGAYLTTHPDVKLISFTGETTTGKVIMAAGAPTLKRVSFELGGKGNNIIFADADLEKALDVTMRAAFYNQGEVCLAGSRIFVEQPIYDRFMEMLLERVKALRPGDPLDMNTTLGPVIAQEHFDRVMGFIDRAKAQGVECLTGGGRAEGLPAPFDGGYFIAPTVFAAPDPSVEIVQEEVFGPVVSVTPFTDDEWVLDIINAGRYGLSSVVQGRDITRLHRMAQRLQSGNVWINSWFVRDLRVPFGGMKESGIGREGGMHSLDFYTELQTIGIPTA